MREGNELIRTSFLALSEAHKRRLDENGLGITDPAPLEIPDEMQGSGGNFFGHFLPTCNMRTRPHFRRFQLLFPEQEAATTRVVKFWHTQYAARMREQPLQVDPDIFFRDVVSEKLLFAYQVMAQLVDVNDPGYAEDVERYDYPNVFIEH